VIWLYAICDRPDLPPPAPLDALVEGGLTAIFTRTGAPGEPTVDALWAHERVVERLMTDRAVLPMRFGSTLADDAALRTLLIEHRDRFRNGLARVTGRVELGVRVLQPAAAALPTNGRDYLLGKLQNDHAAAELHTPLAALAVEASRQSARGADEVLRGAYLVDTRELALFGEAVDRLRRDHPDAAIVCTGPWPPYSFVS
jgi:hypothetical protein